jgi:hypothetical protein
VGDLGVYVRVISEWILNKHGVNVEYIRPTQDDPCESGNEPLSFI